MKKIIILNGPNLNMLGLREPEIYGTETLDDIAQHCQNHATELGLDINFVQSNSEGDMVTLIQQARHDKLDGIIINAAAYTHTSVAIMDALIASELPVIEVHLSNVYKREEFRHTSYISKIAQGSICGFGGYGYILSLDAMHKIVNVDNINNTEEKG